MSADLIDSLNALSLSDIKASPVPIFSREVEKVENEPWKQVLRVHASFDFMERNGLVSDDHIGLKMPGISSSVIFVRIWPSARLKDVGLEISTGLLEMIQAEKLPSVLWFRPPGNCHFPKNMKVKSASNEPRDLQSIRSFLLAMKYLDPRLALPKSDHFPSFTLSCDYSALPLIITQSTSFEFLATEPESSSPETMGKSIAGLEKESAALMEMIKICFEKSELFRKHDIVPPRGALLYGPPGTGKTLLARHLCRQLGVHHQMVDGSDLVSKYHGESEAKLREIFVEARNNAPSIIFIDEIDSVCPKRSGSSSTESRVVATLLTLMDGADGNRGDIFVLAAANEPNSLDSALRRSGRLDRELEIGVPTASSRFSILESIISQISHDLEEEEMMDLASKTHGFVGADLASLVRESLAICLGRTSSSLSVVSYSDCLAALKLVKPSSLRASIVEVPKVKWSDIAGQEDVKRALKESVELPLRHPEKFLRLGLKPPKGVLLYGPPGCSKTLLAKALASESGLNFIAVKGPELLSKWVGDSEKAINTIFNRARSASPSIIFFDEFDAIGSCRGSGDSNSVSDRVLTQILCEMDGLDPLSDVTIIAATNRPDSIDPALLRPGRFDRKIYVKLPDEVARKAIFKMQSLKSPYATDVDLDHLAKISEGLTGAEIVHFCQEAAYSALDQELEQVSMAEFLATLPVPRVSHREIEYYDSQDQH